jgi:hypothetical protein
MVLPEFWILILKRVKITVMFKIKMDFYEPFLLFELVIFDEISLIVLKSKN